MTDNRDDHLDLARAIKSAHARLAASEDRLVRERLLAEMMSAAVPGSLTREELHRLDHAEHLLVETRERFSALLDDIATAIAEALADPEEEGS